MADNYIKKEGPANVSSPGFMKKIKKNNTNNMKPERLHGKKNVNKERRKRFPSSFNQRT